MFFFQKVRFSQHFPPKILFLIFVLFLQLLIPKFFLTGHIYLRNRHGEYVQNIAKRGSERGVWAKDFDRICFNFAPLPQTAFFTAKTDFHFIFSEIQNSYAEKNCCFRSQNRLAVYFWK